MYIYIYISNIMPSGPLLSDPPLRFYQKYPVKNSFFQLFPSQKNFTCFAFRMSFKTQHPQHPGCCLTNPSHPVKSCPKGGYTKEAPKKGSVVLAGPAGELTSSWQTAAPEARQDRRFTEVAEEHVLLFVDETGSLLAGVQGWGLPDTGVF